MMKKFIGKKVSDFKFRRAGEGHRLDDTKPTKPQPTNLKASPAHHSPSSSSQAAGEAALARLGGEKGGGGGGGRTVLPSSTTRLSTKAPAAGSTGISASHESKNQQDTPVVQMVDTVSGATLVVCLICPVCKRSIPHKDMQHHLSLCLQEEYLKEPLTSSVHMIHALCRNTEKRRLCIETLSKYLDNVIDHPGEERYRRIRMENKVFVERVKNVEGATLFLEAVGFQQKLLPHEDTEQQFYVLPEEDHSADEEHLRVCSELLSSSPSLHPTLDRNITLYRPSQRLTHFDLSADFFNLSVDEIRRDQKQRTEAWERDQVLRTRAMRERDEIKLAVKHYRYTLLRVRLPEGLFIQAVFRPLERVLDLRQVVCSVLVDPTLTFSLTAFGHPLKEDGEILAQLGLVPSAVINLSWTGAGPEPVLAFLEPDLVAGIRTL